MAEKDPKPPKLVNATWAGTFVGTMEDGTQLIPGETVVKIPEPEAQASDHWRVGGKPKPAGDED